MRETVGSINTIPRKQLNINANIVLDIVEKEKNIVTNGNGHILKQ